MAVPVKIQKINDLAQPNPVNKIPCSAGKDQGECKNRKLLLPGCDPKHIQDCTEGHYRNANQKRYPEGALGK